MFTNSIVGRDGWGNSGQRSVLNVEAASRPRSGFFTTEAQRTHRKQRSDVNVGAASAPRLPPGSGLPHTAAACRQTPLQPRAAAKGKRSTTELTETRRTEVPDVFTKRKRSEVMSRIRSRGNKETEIALAKLFRTAGITGWRRQQIIRLPATARRAGPARPTNNRTDFVFCRQHVVVFVDGCFWHGCPRHSPAAVWLRKSAMPEQTAVSRQWSVISGGDSKRELITENRQLRTGKAFWRQKLAANQARDKFVTRALLRRRWRVVRIWEHDLRKPEAIVVRIVRALRGRMNYEG
jgi:DNA mismatch endonuclease (patch repair protein)